MPMVSLKLMAGAARDKYGSRVSARTTATEICHAAVVSLGGLSNTPVRIFKDPAPTPTSRSVIGVVCVWQCA